MKIFLSSLAALWLAQPVYSQGTDLGGGVVTRTDVEYLADLTKDIRDMKDVIGNEGGSDDALAIYLNGKNSQQTVGTPFRLTQLSSDLASRGVGQGSPQYLFHLLGMAGLDQSGTSGPSDNLFYADNFVRTAILEGRSTAPTAALILNMWMYATHALFVGLKTCQTMVEADNPAQFQLGMAGFDEVIALWIGRGSNPGSSEGDSLYALAEDAYELFGGELDESPDNSKIKSLYQEASAHLSIPGVCTKEHEESPRKLWSIGSQIISQMQVSLIRQLISAIVSQDTEQTQLFAMAVVPQAAQCRPSAYKQLSTYLMGDAPNFEKTPLILRDLQDIYTCFGLTCEDIGELFDNEGVRIPECVAADRRAPLTTYNPTSDVYNIARMDLDILQMRVLTSVGAFDYAKLWYLYGRNSPVERLNENDPFEYYSLADLAVATSRRNADPWYSEFVRYHNSNSYADKIIRETFEGVGKWGAGSWEQRSAVITESSAFMVIYIHLIAQINDAVNQCKGLRTEGEYDLTHPWDEVAALVIGSLEGQNEGGSADVEDGQFIWSLASRRGFQFQTLNRQGYAKSNSELEDLLYAGKGEIDALECEAFEKTAERIKLLTLIPILQSILRYAALNQNLPANSESADIALGETFALAVIPIMELIDPASAVVVEENMISQSGIAPTRGGAQAVADAIGGFAVSAGLKCHMLGYTPEARPCDLYGGHSSAFGVRPWVVATMASAAVSLLLFL